MRTRDAFGARVALIRVALIETSHPITLRAFYSLISQKRFTLAAPKTMLSNRLGARCTETLCPPLSSRAVTNNALIPVRLSLSPDKSSIYLLRADKRYLGDIRCWWACSQQSADGERERLSREIARARWYEEIDFSLPSPRPSRALYHAAIILIRSLTWRSTT